MKTWSILFAIAAIVALIATIAGRYQQIFVFAIAASMSYICWYTHYQEKKRSKNTYTEANKQQATSSQQPST
jgi:membrane protein implicated in regulation of membrane protease activity